MTIRIVLILLSFAFIPPAATSAQPPPVIEVRSAFGATSYLHGDFDFVTPTFLLAVRFGGETMAIEPEFAYAWHEETDTFPGTPEFPGPVTTTSSRSFQSVGINVVRRWSGRVSPFFGGGVGVYWEPRRFDTRSGDQAIAIQRTEGPRGGVQGFGGVDVRVNRWIGAFGQVRFEMRSLQDPAGGAFQGLGGVALRIR